MQSAFPLDTLQEGSRYYTPLAPTPSDHEASKSATPRLSSWPASNSGRRHSSVPVCVVDKRWGIFKPDEKLQLCHCERLSVLGRLSPKSLKVRGVSVRMQQGFGSEMMKWYPAAHCFHLIRRPASAAKSRYSICRRIWNDKIRHHIYEVTATHAYFQSAIKGKKIWWVVTLR